MEEHHCYCSNAASLACFSPHVVWLTYRPDKTKFSLPTSSVSSLCVLQEEPNIRNLQFSSSKSEVKFYTWLQNPIGSTATERLGMHMEFGFTSSRCDRASLWKFYRSLHRHILNPLFHRQAHQDTFFPPTILSCQPLCFIVKMFSAMTKTTRVKTTRQKVYALAKQNR